MQRKAKKKNLPTILSRWKAQESYRTSLAKHDIGEKEIIPYDQIALERHDSTAARAERHQNSKHWVISINAEGPQTTSTTTPRLCQSKKKNVSARRVYGGNKPALQTNSSEQTMRENPNQQIEGSEDHDYVVDWTTGWKWYKEQQGNLPHTSSSSSSSWQDSSWQNWNSWWWHSSKPDEAQ